MSKSSVFLRAPFNYDVDKASLEAALFIDPAEKLTKQEFTEECDVNYIMDRFIKGGDIVLNSRTPRYGDFTDAPGSYHEALNLVRSAERAFMDLPAVIRSKFDNDPGKYLEFVSNPDNTDQARELGISMPGGQVPSTGAVERAQHAGATDPVEGTGSEDSASPTPSKSKAKGG